MFVVMADGVNGSPDQTKNRIFPIEEHKKRREGRKVVTSKAIIRRVTRVRDNQEAQESDIQTERGGEAKKSKQ